MSPSYLLRHKKEPISIVSLGRAEYKTRSQKSSLPTFNISELNKKRNSGGEVITPGDDDEIQEMDDKQNTYTEKNYSRKRKNNVEFVEVENNNNTVRKTRRRIAKNVQVVELDLDNTEKNNLTETNFPNNLGLSNRISIQKISEVTEIKELSENFLKINPVFTEKNNSSFTERITRRRMPKRTRDFNSDDEILFVGEPKKKRFDSVEITRIEKAKNNEISIVENSDDIVMLDEENLIVEDSNVVWC